MIPSIPRNVNAQGRCEDFKSRGATLPTSKSQTDFVCGLLRQGKLLGDHTMSATKQVEI